MGALTVFAVASYCVPALATVVFRFIDTAETGDMSVGRVDVWLKAFSMFGNHSLVGIGWGQYVNQGGWFWNIHNIYIQLLVETGIIGFIIYCGWFFVSSSKDMVDIFKDACKSRRLYEHRLLLDEFFRWQCKYFLYYMASQEILCMIVKCLCRILLHAQ